ncbi:MAG: hydrogenase maturation nickel metallochaperone HypA [Candidatus Bathyarchaeia archaeon]
MHEGTITTQLVQSVLKQATERKAKKVVEVDLEIGQLTFLNPEQVMFWFEMLTKDTILEGSKLVIEDREGAVRCSQCGYEGGFKYEDDSAFHMPMPTLQCPECDAKVEIVGGKDCLIKRVKMIV